MSEVRIQRISRTIPVVLTTSVDQSTTLRLDDLVGGAISVSPLGGATSTVSVYSASEPNAAFYQVCKPDGSAVSVAMLHGSSTGAVYALPTEVYGLPYARLVAGGAAAQGVAAVVTLKS